MEKYSIEGTPKTPSINFDLNGGILEVKGRSIPENSIDKQSHHCFCKSKWNCKCCR